MCGTCGCSHCADQYGGDAQHQAECRGGEAGDLGLRVGGGGQNPLVESLVGQSAQCLLRTHKGHMSKTDNQFTAVEGMGRPSGK